MIRTAVEGTLNVMRAALKYKVKRVVITSSTAVIIDRASNVPRIDINEDEWADENTTENSYSKSKILQEKAAWKYWESIPEEQRFELVAIAPGSMFGPAFKLEKFATANVIQAIFTYARVFGFPKIYYQIVDVRESAFAHL